MLVLSKNLGYISVVNQTYMNYKNVKNNSRKAT